MGAVGNDKLARRKLLHEVELEGRRLFYKAVVRHKRDAKADTRQVDQKIVAAKLNFRHEVELEPLKLAVQELTRGTNESESCEDGWKDASLDNWSR